MATLQYYKKYEDTFDPILPYPQSPGCELRSALDYTIKPGQRLDIRTDLVVKITSGYYGKVNPKPAGQGKGLSVLRTYIESNNATEVLVTVANQYDVDMDIRRGQVVALLIVCKVETPRILQRHTLAELSDTFISLPTIEMCKMSSASFLPIEVDGGFVLRSPYYYEIEKGCKEAVCSGLAFKLPSGFCARIEPTDAQTWLWNVSILGGEVLTNSKKEVKFLIHNGGSSVYKVAPGDKIGVLRLKKLHNFSTEIKSKADMDIVDYDEDRPQKIQKVNDGLNFKIMIVLRSAVPDADIAEKFFQALQSFVDDIFKNIRLDSHESNKVFIHCRKEFNDRCVTFFLSLFGDVLNALQFSEDYLERVIVKKMKDTSNSLSLKCFVKVVAVKGESL